MIGGRRVLPAPLFAFAPNHLSPTPYHLSPAVQVVKGPGLARRPVPPYLSRLAALRPISGGLGGSGVPTRCPQNRLSREILMPRDKIILACSDCKNRNYFTTKNKRLHPERVEWKKYCPRCNKHVVHKETK